MTINSSLERYQIWPENEYNIQDSAILSFNQISYYFNNYF